MTREEKIKNIKESVHSPLKVSEYNSTNVRNNTNCYSHAIGATFPYLDLYRIGAICGKKSIDEKYFDTQEIENLLFADCEILDLQIKKSSMEEELPENYYKIALFVAINNEKIIWDYHFIRNDKGEWTEKRKGINVQTFYNNDISKYMTFPWNLVGYYKIKK